MTKVMSHIIGVRKKADSQKGVRKAADSQKKGSAKQKVWETLLQTTLNLNSALISLRVMIKKVQSRMQDTKYRLYTCLKNLRCTSFTNAQKLLLPN